MFAIVVVITQKKQEDRLCVFDEKHLPGFQPSQILSYECGSRFILCLNIKAFTFLIKYSVETSSYIFGQEDVHDLEV